MKTIEVKELMYCGNPILIAKDGDNYAVVNEAGIMIIRRTKHNEECECFDILDKAFQDGNVEPFIAYILAEVQEAAEYVAKQKASAKFN